MQGESIPEMKVGNLDGKHMMHLESRHHEGENDIEIYRNGFQKEKMKLRMKTVN